MEIYQGNFSCWKDVILEFHGASYKDGQAQNNILELNPEPDQVFLAAYGGGGYDGDALVAFRIGDKYYTVEGSHCSCYGLEDQWSPEEYDYETFMAVLDRKIESAYSEGGDYPSSDKTMWRLIKKRAALLAEIMEKKDG